MNDTNNAQTHTEATVDVAKRWIRSAGLELDQLIPQLSSNEDGTVYHAQEAKKDDISVEEIIKLVSAKPKSDNGKNLQRNKSKILDSANAAINQAISALHSGISVNSLLVAFRIQIANEARAAKEKVESVSNEIAECNERLNEMSSKKMSSSGEPKKFLFFFIEKVISTVQATEEWNRRETAEVKSQAYQAAESTYNSLVNRLTNMINSVKDVLVVVRRAKAELEASQRETEVATMHTPWLDYSPDAAHLAKLLALAVNTAPYVAQAIGTVFSETLSKQVLQTTLQIASTIADQELRGRSVDAMIKDEFDAGCTAKQIQPPDDAFVEVMNILADDMRINQPIALVPGTHPIAMSITLTPGGAALIQANNDDFRRLAYPGCTDRIGLLEVLMDIHPEKTRLSRDARSTFNNARLIVEYYIYEPLIQENTETSPSIHAPTTFEPSSNGHRHEPISA